MAVVVNVAGLMYTNDSQCFQCTVTQAKEQYNEEGNIVLGEPWSEPYTFSLTEPWGTSFKIRKFLDENPREIHTPADWNSNPMWFPNTPFVGNFSGEQGDFHFTIFGCDTVSHVDKIPSHLKENMGELVFTRIRLEPTEVKETIDGDIVFSGFITFCETGEDQTYRSEIIFTVPRDVKSNIGAWLRRCNEVMFSMTNH